MSESGGEPPRGRPRTGFDPDPQQVRGTPRPDQQPQPQTQPDTTVADGGTDRGQLTRRPVQRNLQPQADAGDGQGQTQNNARRSPGWGGQQGNRPGQQQGGGFQLATARGRPPVREEKEPKKEEKEPEKIEVSSDDDSVGIAEQKKPRLQIDDRDDDKRPRKAVTHRPDGESDSGDDEPEKIETGDDDVLPIDSDSAEGSEDDAPLTTTASSTQPRQGAWGGVRAPTRPVQQRPQPQVGLRQQANNTTTTTITNRQPQPQPVVQQPKVVAPVLDRKEGSVDLKKIDKLPPEQRLWSDNVLRALNLPSKGSQARVVAGAIASAELVMQTGSDPDKQAAKRHRQAVIDAGPPPWKKATDAMQATNARVQLDLLSIPPQQRQLKRLDATSDNKTYWINSVGPDGKTAKAFLCKPATEPGHGTKVSGGPRGGEVAREALAGRAAQVLLGQTGIDIGMPETHVVKLDDQFLPDGAGDGSTPTCSVQEARPANGDLRGKSGAALAGLDPTQVAGIAIYDTITLNTDRHAGNVLTGTDGKLVPIDHGEAFAEPTEVGLGRVALAVGGPHNAMLQIPCAHDPLSPAMVKQLKGLDPEGFAQSLARDRDAVAEVHPDMEGMISDAAIEAARRSAEFVKLAAKAKPPLSAAATQVALGGYAKELLDPAKLDGKAFRKRAEEVIRRTAEAADAIKDVCTASDAEYDVLCKQVAALGWRVQDRNTPPMPNCVTDPVMMISIVQNQIRFKKQAELKLPKRADEDASNAEQEAAKKAREQARADYAAEGAEYIDSVRRAFNPGTASDAMDNATQQAMGQLLTCLAPADVADMKLSLRDVAGQPQKQQKAAYRALCAQMGQLAFAYQKQRFDTIETNHQLAELRRADLLLAGKKSYEDAAVASGYGNALALAPDVNDLDQIASRDGFIPLAVASLTKEINIQRGKFTIPDDDADLLATDAALQNRDPAEGYTCYVRLLTRCNRGEFPAKAQTTKTEKTDGT